MRLKSATANYNELVHPQYPNNNDGLDKSVTEFRLVAADIYIYIYILANKLVRCYG